MKYGKRCLESSCILSALIDDIWVYMMTFAGCSTSLFMCIRRVSKYFKARAEKMIPYIDVKIRDIKSFWMSRANLITSCIYYGEYTRGYQFFPFHKDVNDPLLHMNRLRKLMIVQQPMYHDLQLPFLPTVTHICFKNCWMQALDLSILPNITTLRFKNCWTTYDNSQMFKTPFVKHLEVIHTKKNHSSAAFLLSKIRVSNLHSIQIDGVITYQNNGNFWLKKK